MTSPQSPWAALSRPSNFLSNGTKLDGRVEPGHGEVGTGYPHSLSPTRPCQTPRMTTPIIAAALSRKPRRNPHA
ncbi:MAG TPA: hypothetical protein VG798_07040, partial [Rhizomicrobium sp.]|nr:hypothetical protein [Rhizomicrobium sp.]